MRLTFRTALVVTLAFGSLTAAKADAAPAQAPRKPGPALLYAAPPRAPQLENTGSWRAKPILISGASAYRNGEFLYQDFLFDDLGANSTYTYPTDPAYAGNAADIVEVRLKLLASSTAVRITYNSMTDPELVAATLAFGTSQRAYPMPFGANTSAPAKVFVTVGGARGMATDAATGRGRPGKVRVRTDLKRRQVDVRVPFSVYDPRGKQVRVGLGAGLWDPVRGRYLVPQTTASTTSLGGASGAAPSAFFNIAFRYAEPFFATDPARDRLGWHDSQQAAALANGTFGEFAATVDFGKLAAGITDDMRGRSGGVPIRGHLAMIHASRFAPDQGRGVGTNPCLQPCDRLPEYPGQLQPYTAYVPAGPTPKGGWGLTLFLHACGNNYTPFDSVVMTPVGDRKPGSIVIAPNARGNCEWYWSLAGADVFEAWNDAKRRWRLNPDYTAAYGVSMGGYGSYKLATTYPDLFARIVTVVGCVTADTFWLGDPTVPISGPATSVIPLIGSLRHVPLRSYAEVADATCTVSSQNKLKDALDQQAYRYEWVRAVGAHTSVGVNFSRVAAFLGAARVDRNPARVSYVLNGRMDERRYGLGLDGAYWVSGLRLSKTGGVAPRGTIDVRSEGFGTGDASSSTPMPAPGLEGQYQSYPHVEQSRVWSPPRRIRRADVLRVTASNIRHLVIDPRRARVTCAAKVYVKTDVPVDVVLSGCHRVVRGRP